MSRAKMKTSPIDEDVASSEYFSEYKAEILVDTENQIYWHKRQILDLKLKKSKAPFFLRGFYARKVGRLSSALSQLVIKRQQYLV